MNRDLLQRAVDGAVVQHHADGKWVDLSLEGAVRHYLNYGTDQRNESRYRRKPDTITYQALVTRSPGKGPAVFHSYPSTVPTWSSWQPNIEMVFEDGTLVDATFIGQTDT